MWNTLFILLLFLPQLIYDQLYFIFCFCYHSWNRSNIVRILQKKKKQQLHIQIINEYVSPPLLIIIHQITNSTPNLGRLSLIISNCLCLYMPISGCINKKAHKNIREKKLQVFSGWWRWRLCQASNTSYTPNGLPLYVVIKQRAATQPNIQRV